MTFNVLRKTICLLILFIILPTNYAIASAQTPITIDGYYNDWSGLPYSWEYNHNNPYIIEHFWDGTQNITKVYTDENGNPYNLEIRHKMALYFDGEYVYLHIQISDKPGSGMNGEDYRFYVDDKMAAFRVTYAGGDHLNKHDKKTEPSIYFVEVRHRDGGISNMVVEGATAAFTKNPDDKNNELELKIPLSAFKLQNNEISIGEFNLLEFYCPNLMYRRIACSGVSTSPIIGIAFCLVIVGVVLYVNKRKLRGKEA